MKQKDNLIKTVAVGITGGGIGLTAGWLLWGQIQTSPVNNGYRTTIGNQGLPILERQSIQPDIHHTYSGGTLGTTTSGFLGSGSYSYSDGGMYETGCSAISNQQNDMPYSSPFFITSGVEPVTNTSSVGCSGTYVSSHLENIHLQDAHTIAASPSVFIPSYTYSYLTPPDNPLDSPLWQQILKTTGPEFELYLKGFLEFQGNRVTLTPGSHDEGTDLIAEKPGEKLVIQAKQWKDNIGVRAIEEACTAKHRHPGVTRAIVIITSKFTESALKLAKAVGVECWDGTRLLEELYKWRYFIPPI